MTLCELKNVTKTYLVGEKVTPVENISLSIGKGEFIAIAGESGIGKSTLLMLARGLLRPTEGSVFLMEMITGRCQRKSRRSLDQKRLDICFNQFSLYRH